jgi:N-acetylmuramoyl-L-alanine amidase
LIAMTLLNKPQRMVPLVLAIVWIGLLRPVPLLAGSAKADYFRAERCYRQLQNHPDQLKYREGWLRCINGFLSVHKQEPRGVWASVSLFQAGRLYAELYRHSYFEGDKQEALDIFDRVIRGYPKSRYSEKALALKKALIKGDPAPESISGGETLARSRYQKAQADYQRLQQNPKLKKFRDQWLRCVHAYEQAYQTDPKGPLAPAALLGMADSYDALSRNSFSQSDRDQARAAYQRLIAEFGTSTYADKARAALNGPGASDGGSDAAAADQSSGDSGPVGGDQIGQLIEARSSGGGSAGEDAPQMASPEELAQVEGLRYWSNPRYTRVVIDADRDTIFTYRELREDPAIGKPQRIYIDVHNSRLSQNLQTMVPINDNLLKDARAGQYAGNIVRVVVDIKSFKTFKIFSLKNPFRVVLDVWGVDTEAAQATPVQPPASATAGSSGGKIPPSAIAKQLALGVRRIIIDPGHGGKDYGAPGYLKGVHEKNITLEIAKRLKVMICEQLKCQAILTRDKDEYLSLEERTAIANTQNADLFISIHTNASRDSRAYGVETYILNLATDDEAIRVAAMENATSAKNISDLDSILQDLMQNAKVNESTRLAGYVQQAMDARLRKGYDTIRNKGIKQAPFYVLLGADMPSILVETSFISNPRECRRLTSVAYQKQLCQGIVDGVRRYIKETKPMAFEREALGKEQG